MKLKSRILIIFYILFLPWVSLTLTSWLSGSKPRSSWVIAVCTYAMVQGSGKVTTKSRQHTVHRPTWFSGSISSLPLSVDRHHQNKDWQSGPWAWQHFLFCALTSHERDTIFACFYFCLFKVWSQLPKVTRCPVLLTSFQIWSKNPGDLFTMCDPWQGPRP